LRPVDQAFPDRQTTGTGQAGGFDPSVEDPNSPAFIEKLKGYAAKEGFKVNVDRGDEQQGQQYASYEKGGQRAVDPQHVAMPNMGQPGQISVVALAQRVFADQLFMAPLGLALFISTMAVLEGLEWDQIVERYKALYLPILLINWQM
jgi:protein Mpv17